jgi:hypothetical protein
MLNRSFLKNLSLIFCLTVLLSFAFAQDVKPFVGTWSGALSVMGQELEIEVDFTLDDDGNLQGTIDVPMQGATDIPLINAAVEGKKITFVIDGAPGEPTFAGELDEAGTKIEGTFTQSGYEGTFSIEKK